MPANNLLDHLVDVDTTDEIRAVLGVYEATWWIYRVLDFCIEELFMACKNLFVTIPQMLRSSLKLLSTVFNFHDTFTDVLGATEDGQQSGCTKKTLSANYKLMLLKFNPGDILLHSRNCGVMFDTLHGLSNAAVDFCNRRETISHEIINASRALSRCFENLYSSGVGRGSYEEWLQYSRLV